MIDLDMRMTVKWEEGMVTVMKDLLAALRGDIKTGREVVEVMVMHLTEEVLKGQSSLFYYVLFWSSECAN